MWKETKNGRAGVDMSAAHKVCQLASASLNWTIHIPLMGLIVASVINTALICMINCRTQMAIHILETG